MSATHSGSSSPRRNARPRQRYRTGRFSRNHSSRRPESTAVGLVEMANGREDYPHNFNASPSFGDGNGMPHNRPGGVELPVMDRVPGNSRHPNGSIRTFPLPRQPITGSSFPGAGESTLEAATRPRRGGPQPSRGSRAGRSFHGHLTSTLAPSGARSAFRSTLHAEAPEFQPTQQQHAQGFDVGDRASQANALSSTIRTSRVQRFPKSSAPDVTTRTHEDISHGVYECPICTNDLGARTPIWSCRTCWTVFHLGCIQRWSRSRDSGQTSDDENSVQRSWRCPGCNLSQDVRPSDYYCWCGKEIDPHSPPGLPPHSCGQTCGRARALPKRCPHPCELTCHAGPCPPCSRLGPPQPCFCGKASTTRRCADTDYDRGWSCGTVCKNNRMSCGQHSCNRTCHQGPCGVCEEGVATLCYCGKVERLVPCHTKGPEIPSQKVREDGDSRTIESWKGSLGCGEICGRLFDCGKHRCRKGCHPQDALSAHCPWSPELISHCPCGKTSIERIRGGARQTCTDPIPNCPETCGKTLECGHDCDRVCHAGACTPCTKSISIKCRCRRTQSTMTCHQGVIEQPQCGRLCKTTLNCGRHECGERCCAGESKAIERQAAKRRQRHLDVFSPTFENQFEPEHICTRVCYRKLMCGNHRCSELFHKRPCRTCREAIFDELSCHCGRTVLQPPSPCGTRPPTCTFLCERPKLCGHPRVDHNCHGNDEPCPNCPFLMEKGCMCGKKVVKNQQCWRTDVGCGEICGKLLRCGSHRCRKQCHRSGECEDADRSCQQACGKAKKACGHSCEGSCHAPYACQEDQPCQHKILVTCPCQNLKKEMRCLASRSGPGNQKESLPCDGECGRLERNRKLALALNIDQETHQDDHIPYGTETLDYFRANTKWAQVQERAMRVFAADESEKRMRFKPMPAHQREFLHALADDFGFDSESLDPEPYRHVVLLKTPRFVIAPTKTVSQCLEIKGRNRALLSTRLNTTTTTATTESSVVERAAVLASADGGVGANVSDRPFNGFLLCRPRFALTLDELHCQLDPIFDAVNPRYKMEIDFLPSEEVLIRPGPGPVAVDVSERGMESYLRALYPSLNRVVVSKQLAARVLYCRVNQSLDMLRRDVHFNHGDDGTGSETGMGTGFGWSKVAAKAAAPARNAPMERAMGVKSLYTVLGSRAREARDHQMNVVFRQKTDKKNVVIGGGGGEGAVEGRKPRQLTPEVVDDWERAEEEEEIKEAKKGSGIINGDGDQVDHGNMIHFSERP